ncbi:NAD(+) diphosphatase [Chachezhania antarctica]|uniref:NAD(+) diphosphatase n=1 Tax=Chachezhania antarctica TaxID=2340860 RepID=UPI000EB4BD4A|nr:NAD(+) diphosphatase [Chachezhania antarctica]|tara:strand:- start:16477 stop:17460 length:984 start_codon:yes stop_codon:yes gene_type:complete
MKHAETVTFGGSGFDRAAHIRNDPAALEAERAHPRAAALLIWRGKPMVTGGDAPQLALVPMQHPLLSSGLGRTVRDPVFLGREEDGSPLFACDISGWEPEGQDLSAVGQFVDPSLQHHPAFPDDCVFIEIRRAMTSLSPRDAELMAMAKAVISWHEIHPFCARCGAASDITHGGWQRICPACGGHHFPRTDPVVIMLILDGEDVLLGRAPSWPDGMYSLLAGFVEPGETLEAAVRREVFEESGVEVGEVGYLSSQPWPFPASLMFGCVGHAKSREIKIDEVELSDARWVSRSEMVEVFAGQHPDIRPPRHGAIAQFLLKNWVADTLD